MNLLDMTTNSVYRYKVKPTYFPYISIQNISCPLPDPYVPKITMKQNIRPVPKHILQLHMYKGYPVCNAIPVTYNASAHYLNVRRTAP